MTFLSWCYCAARENMGFYLLNWLKSIFDLNYPNSKIFRVYLDY